MPTKANSKSPKQTLAFQAEVAQLLKLVTHSLYSNPEIFLRELVSNASDACDKLRFESLNNAALLESDPDLKVRITFDKDAKTLTITDNGIGLSEQEAIDNLGTIAKSGTRDFMAKLSGDQKNDAQLIGQFGVGFYRALSWPTASRLKAAVQACRLLRACAGPAKAPASLKLRPSNALIAARRSRCI